MEEAAELVPEAVGDPELDGWLFTSPSSQATNPFLVGASVCVMAPTKTQSLLKLGSKTMRSAPGDPIDN